MTISPGALSAIDAINRRASVRSYTAEPIDPATVRSLLAAAVRAPTALHQEPWAFVVIQDAEWLKRFSDRAKPIFLADLAHIRFDGQSRVLEAFGQPDFNVFYNAGTLIAICGDLSSPLVQADCWLAAENLMLAACAMGLGTCVIGSASAAFNGDDVKRELGIPADMQVIAPIVVGVPDEAPAPSARKEARVLCWKSAG